MTTITDIKQARRFANFLTLAYTVSYITRINFGAVVVEMVSATGLARSELSLALTGAAITYGLGQLLSGYFGDRFQPKTLVLAGLATTTLMNLLVPFCQNFVIILILWCINGLAQAFMWPPIARLTVVLMPPEEYSRASVRVSWGSSFGNIIVYLAAPVIISFLSWKYVFWISAFIGLLMCFLWQKLCYRIDTLPAPSASSTTVQKKAPFHFTPLIIFSMLAIVLQGSLRDGVTTWMPSYISETYNFSNAAAILTGVVLPLFSIISFQIAAALYRKLSSNPLLTSAVFFLIASAAALSMFLIFGKSALASVLFAAILTGCMHGINFSLIVMIPLYYKSLGNVSFVSGMLNSCTYIGSSISTYGIAALSESAGWEITLLTWLAITLAGTIICFLFTGPWKRFAASHKAV
ncbi:MAG: MFS transporter [Ruminococcaceae bacterium]|nr:MFS transporter [Oscillospiraceae bacterium]